LATHHFKRLEIARFLGPHKHLLPQLLLLFLHGRHLVHFWVSQIVDILLFPNTACSYAEPLQQAQPFLVLDALPHPGEELL
jgi:hypothetical protein